MHTAAGVVLHSSYDQNSNVIPSFGACDALFQLASHPSANRTKPLCYMHSEGGFLFHSSGLVIVANTGYAHKNMN